MKKGDTLWKIAKEHYGDGNLYPEIFKANQDVLSDPDKIQVGQVRYPRFRKKELSMKSRSLFTGFLSMALAALLLVGCANQMEPAQKAIADVEAAIAAAGPDAAQYIPDQLQAVTGQLADLKAKFDKKDYKGVIAAAPALLTQAQPRRPRRPPRSRQ